MIALYEVVEVRHLANHDFDFTWCIDRVHDCLVGAALVHQDFLGNLIGLHGFFKESKGCGFARLGD